MLKNWLITLLAKLSIKTSLKKKVKAISEAEALNLVFYQFEKTLDIRALTQEGNRLKIHFVYKGFDGTEYRKEKVMEGLPSGSKAFW